MRWGACRDLRNTGQRCPHLVPAGVRYLPEILRAINPTSQSSEMCAIATFLPRRGRFEPLRVAEVLRVTGRHRGTAALAVQSYAGSSATFHSRASQQGPRPSQSGCRQNNVKQSSRASSPNGPSRAMNDPRGCEAAYGRGMINSPRAKSPSLHRRTPGHGATMTNSSALLILPMGRVSCTTAGA